jgi:FkbH-like protein
VKLREALESIRRPRPAGAERARYLLGCSSTPTHLQTFLHAHLLSQLPTFEIEIEPTTYGDLLGSLERFEPRGYAGAAVVCEWYDLDPRLGFRRLGGWGPSLFADIVGGVRAALSRLQRAVEKISAVIPVAVALPTLPLPPLEICVPAQTAGFEVELWSSAWEFARWCNLRSGVRLLSTAELDRRSAPLERFDLRAELSHGCPYQLAHISVLAEVMSALLAPAPPLKGIITDLDDTLWAGILGEVGVSGVSFALETGAQIHGLYQQLLQSLAERGVLVAIASKNDADLAEQALARPDLLVRRESFFPVEIHWRSKSVSVGRILKAWTIGPEAVAFIDDSSLEAAEVQESFPALRTLLFPTNDPTRLLQFFHTLRAWFGKPTIREEDRIRAQSLRSNVAMPASAEDPLSREAFLATIDARLSFELSRDQNDERALELVNKTNQFNLNGRRISEACWREMLADREFFLLTVGYRDKFGPLGKIAVLLGRRLGREAAVVTWVMSCRAFSRRIEHATLRYLFEGLDVERISFAFEATDRNAPLREFFAELGIQESVAVVRREEFFANCPRSFHAIEEVPARV